MQFCYVLGLPEEVPHRFPASDKPVESENLKPSVTFVSGFGSGFESTLDDMVQSRETRPSAGDQN